MKQTAVEWLIEQLADKGILHSADIAKAKTMEKEQIVEAHLEGQFQADGLKANRVAEQYYNETFKSE